MKNKTPYTLNDDEKQEITSLLKLSKEVAPHIFSSLELLMNRDSWLEIGSDGAVTKAKVAARKCRDLEKISTCLDKLSKVLENIDQQVLHHLDDHFSILLWETSQPRGLENSNRRALIPVKELISRTSTWAHDASNVIKTTDGKGYQRRFLAELETFWEWEAKSLEKFSDKKLQKLVAVLLRIEPDSASKIVKRRRVNKQGGGTNRPKQSNFLSLPLSTQQT